MTHSLPYKNIAIQTNSEAKDFRDLSTAEMEQLMNEGVRQAKERMHDKGISTIFSVEDKIYEEHPDGTITLSHG